MDVHATDAEGRTALHRATVARAGGPPETATRPSALEGLLLSLGADPDARDALGRTPEQCVPYVSVQGLVPGLPAVRTRPPQPPAAS